MRCWLLALARGREPKAPQELAADEVVRSTVGLAVDSRGVTKVVAPDAALLPDAEALRSAAELGRGVGPDAVSKKNLRPVGAEGMAKVKMDAAETEWVPLIRDTVVHNKYESLSDMGVLGLTQAEFREFYTWFYDKAHVPFGKDRPQPDNADADALFERVRKRGDDYRESLLRSKGCGGQQLGPPHEKLEDAQNECTRRWEQCSGIYDQHCDAQVADADHEPKFRGPFQLCDSSYGYADADKGCIYERQESNGLAEWENARDAFFPYMSDEEEADVTAMLIESPAGEPVSKKLRMRWRIEFTRICVPDEPPGRGCQLDFDEIVRQLDPESIFRDENKQLAHEIIDGFEAGPIKDGKLSSDEFVAFMEQAASRSKSEPLSVSPTATQQRAEEGMQSRMTTRDRPKAVDPDAIDADEHQRNAENDADLQGLMSEQLVGGDFEGSDGSKSLAALASLALLAAG